MDKDHHEQVGAVAEVVGVPEALEECVLCLISLVFLLTSPHRQRSQEPPRRIFQITLLRYRASLCQWNTIQPHPFGRLSCKNCSLLRFCNHQCNHHRSCNSNPSCSRYPRRPCSRHPSHSSRCSSHTCSGHPTRSHNCNRCPFHSSHYPSCTRSTCPQRSHRPHTRSTCPSHSSRRPRTRSTCPSHSSRRPRTHSWRPSHSSCCPLHTFSRWPSHSSLHPSHTCSRLCSGTPSNHHSHRLRPS